MRLASLFLLVSAFLLSGCYVAYPAYPVTTYPVGYTVVDPYYTVPVTVAYPVYYPGYYTGYYGGYGYRRWWY